MRLHLPASMASTGTFGKSPPQKNQKKRKKKKKKKNTPKKEEKEEENMQKLCNSTPGTHQILNLDGNKTNSFSSAGLWRVTWTTLAGYSGRAGQPQALLTLRTSHECDTILWQACCCCLGLASSRAHGFEFGTSTCTQMQFRSQHAVDGWLRESFRHAHSQPWHRPCSSSTARNAALADV